MDSEQVHDAGRLYSRPGTSMGSAGGAPSGIEPAKLTRLDAGGLLLTPAGRGPVPVLVMLHGAGGKAEDSIGLVRDAAETRRVLVVAPKSRSQTWDVIRGGFGPDVQSIDLLLKQVFESHDVESRKVAIGGFSDGGSYALTLGITNGDLFREILAFSPGFIASEDVNGRPRVYISHGRSDKVLPYGRTGERLAAQLTSAGFAMRFDPFDGGHTVSSEQVTVAFDWWLGNR